MPKPLKKIYKMREELPKMKREVKQLKKDFNNLENACDNVESRVKKSEKEFVEMKEDLDVFIYQNSVIKHLMEAGEKIKLYNSIVTSEYKVLFLDPDDSGTSVDDSFINVEKR